MRPSYWRPRVLRSRDRVGTVCSPFAGSLWLVRGLIAYLPLGCAALAYSVAKTTADHATSGSLDSFFGATPPRPPGQGSTADALA
jgi:hypothetical protein